MVAASDCIAYSFSRQCVMSEILPRHPDLMLALLKTLALKVRILSNQTVCLSLDDLSSRICKFLHLRQNEQDQEGGAQFVSPGLNQQELANLLGVHRVTLNKALRELERKESSARIRGAKCISWTRIVSGSWFFTTNRSAPPSIISPALPCSTKAG